MKTGSSMVLLLAAAVALSAPHVQAETETVDGVEWTYSVADGQATVGTGNWNSTAVSGSVAGHLAVPAVLGGHPVTALAAYAFQNCTRLTDVTIPDSVTDIGLEAFWNCTGMTNVTIPPGVTNIGRMAFYSCTALPSVVLPDGVTRIENSVFECCDALREVAVPSGLTHIGREAFAFCTNLTALALPDSLELLWSGPFFRCSKMVLYVPETWEDLEEKLAQGELPEECPIVRYDATGATRTTKSPAPVPHAWLALKASSVLAANGNDFEAAANATAANGRKVWECYVAGLEPLAKDGDFTAEISFVDGKPEVESVEPDLGTERTYTLQGKKDLMDKTWDDMATVPAGEEDEYRFFCVGVSLPGGSVGEAAGGTAAGQTLEERHGDRPAGL